MPSSDDPKPSTDVGNFSRDAAERPIEFFREFFLFLFENEKCWLVLMLLVLLVLLACWS